jgi:hypothetical protein
MSQSLPSSSRLSEGGADCDLDCAVAIFSERDIYYYPVKPPWKRETLPSVLIAASDGRLSRSLGVIAPSFNKIFISVSV